MSDPNPNSNLKYQICTVKACGAVVVYLEVEEERLAVNPQPISLVVEAPGQGWRVTTGYQPHWTTCVDIEGRWKGRHPPGKHPIP